MKGEKEEGKDKKEDGGIVGMSVKRMERRQWIMKKENKGDTRDTKWLKVMMDRG